MSFFTKRRESITILPYIYLPKKHNSKVLYDPLILNIKGSKFEKQDWSSIVYTSRIERDFKEEIPLNTPSLKDHGFLMRVFVDSDHAGCTIIRRSRTRFFVFLNSALMYSYSKKQKSVAISSFGTKFIAMKHSTEYVRGLCFFI